MTDKQAAADGPIIAESWSAEYIATAGLALPIALTQLATIGMNVTEETEANKSVMVLVSV